MKKIYLGIMLSVIIVVGVTTVAIYNNYNHSKLEVQYLDLNYVDQKSDLKEMVSSSQLVVIGKITKITPVKVHGIIFTDYEIDVDKVIKGEKQNVVVRLTGGTLDNIQQIEDEIKPLNKGQEYIFCLEKVFPKDADSNIFSPIGAYQGILAIDKSEAKIPTSGAVTIPNTDKFKIKKFNDLNVIENALVGKEFDEKDFQ